MYIVVIRPKETDGMAYNVQPCQTVSKKQFGLGLLILTRPMCRNNWNFYSFFILLILKEILN